MFWPQAAWELSGSCAAAGVPTTMLKAIQLCLWSVTIQATCCSQSSLECHATSYSHFSEFMYVNAYADAVPDMSGALPSAASTSLMPCPESVGPCRGPAGEAAGMEHCQGLARNLLEAASLGADAPLNMPLPHTRVMLNSNKGGPAFSSLLAPPPDRCLVSAVLLAAVTIGCAEQISKHVDKHESGCTGEMAKASSSSILEC